MRAEVFLYSIVSFEKKGDAIFNKKPKKPSDKAKRLK